MPRRCEHLPASRPLTAEEADRVADVMSAFGTASRVRLLFALLGAERSVDDLAADTSMTPSAVSQQLRVLRLYRMVEGRREGRRVRYRIADEHVADLLAAVRAHVDHQRPSESGVDRGDP